MASRACENTGSMNRSEINDLIRAAEARFRSQGLLLPEWAHWTIDEWRAAAPNCEAIFATRLGWDITDFGLGDFARTGLLLFTARNGTNAPVSGVSYAEKVMVVGDQQVTPMHFHWSKTEDIINRGGATLVVELVMADQRSEQPTEDGFAVWRDGIRIDAAPGTRVPLAPGQSITLTPYLYHSFWAEGGACTVGEVSSANDDTSDNRFLQPVGRFPTIEEDEPPYRLLCTDYPAALGV